MEPVFDFFVQGMALGFSAGISPGPLLALFMGRSIQDGWRKTLPAAFAPLLSDGPIIILMLVVLSQVPDTFLDILRIAGGLFLLYIAWKTILSGGTGPKDNRSESPGRTLRAAVLINLLNPNPYIFWGTVLGPTLILGWRQSPAMGLAFVLGFYMLMIIIFMAWIILAGTIGRMNTRASRIITGISGIGLALFGLFQIAAGFGLVAS